MFVNRFTDGTTGLPDFKFGCHKLLAYVKSNSCISTTTITKLRYQCPYGEIRQNQQDG